MFTVAGYADGKIVSESFHDEKYFGDLKYNGWNTTSSGNSSIVRYIPNSDKLKYDSIVTSERVEGELVYSVCGKSATNEQYNKACDMFYALPDAIWLDKTEANIKAVFVAVVQQPTQPETPTRPETPSTPATPSDIVAPPKPETPTTPTSPSDIG